VNGLWARFVRRLTAGGALPAEFPAVLQPDERVLAAAALAGGGHLVLTQIGVWVPEGTVPRRVGWHLVSKAVWDRTALLLTEAVTTGSAGEAMLISDLPPHRFVLTAPGPVPELVRQRVTGSIKSSQYHELSGGGAWFVQRKVPGHDGLVLQVRADPGTSADAVHDMASAVAARLPPAAPSD
jgi:hypothetical protein